MESNDLGQSDPKLYIYIIVFILSKYFDIDSLPTSDEREAARYINLFILQSLTHSINRFLTWPITQQYSSVSK